MVLLKTLTNNITHSYISALTCTHFVPGIPHLSHLTANIFTDIFQHDKQQSHHLTLQKRIIFTHDHNYTPLCSYALQVYICFEYNVHHMYCGYTYE